MKLSVITIAYNAGATIEKTLQSVASQVDAEFEYIVQDGGSDDDTLAIVEKYRDSVTVLNSQPDNGIADAMNRALDHATGDYVFMLHADDRFVDSGVLARTASVMDRHPGRDIYAFDVLFGQPPEQRYLRSAGLSWRLNFKQQLWHQGVWASRALFERVGLFDSSYRIAMDYDWVMRVYRAGATIHHEPEPLCVMGDGGLSSQRDLESLRARLAEERRVHLAWAPGPVWRVLYGVYWFAYGPYKLRDEHE